MKTVVVLFLVFWHPDTIRVERLEMASVAECQVAADVARNSMPRLANQIYTARVVNAFCLSGAAQ